MTQSPKVSIITPCLNGEPYLDRYFQCILAQTYPCLELIFVNDGSTDRTEEIALSYRDKLTEKGIIFRYIDQENAGQAAAVNRGLQICAGDYLFWPDSDDRFSDDYIERLVRYMESHPVAGIAQGETVRVYPEESERRPEVQHYRKEEPYKFRDFIFENDVKFGGFMARTAYMREMLPGMYIYENRAGQNWQLLLPVLYKYEFGYVKGTYYYYRIHQDSHSHREKDYASIRQKTYHHEDVVKHSVDVIDMPAEELDKLFQEIEIHYLCKRIRLAARYHQTEDLKEDYRKLKEKTVPPLKYRHLYNKETNTIYGKLYKTYRRVIKKH